MFTQLYWGHCRIMTMNTSKPESMRKISMENINNLACKIQPRIIYKVIEAKIVTTPDVDELAKIIRENWDASKSVHIGLLRGLKHGI